MSVDEMARAASTALHASTEPVRPIGLGRSGRRSSSRQRQLRLAVGVGLVAAVAVGAIVVMANRDDATRVATVPKDVPRLVLGTVPDGLRATGAADLPVGSSPGGTTIGFDTTLYGDEQTASWLASNSPSGAGRRLLVIEATVTGPDSSTPAEGEKVTVNGQEWVVSSFAGKASLNAVIDRRNLVLTGPTLDRDALVALVPSVRVADGVVRLDASTGLRSLATSHVPPSFIMMTGSGAGTATGHIVGYQDAREGNDVVMVSTMIATGDDLVILRANAEHAEPITVRGRGGWAITEVFDTAQAFHSLTWFEADGVLATVSGTRPIADLQAMAESLVAADDATWRELSQPLGAPESDATVIGSGELDGHAWRVIYSSGQGLCLEVQDDAQGSSSSCGDAGIGSSSSSPVGDGTITVRVEPGGGTASPAPECSGASPIPAATNADVVPGAVIAVYVLPGCTSRVDGGPAPRPTIAIDTAATRVVSVSGSSAGPATSSP